MPLSPLRRAFLLAALCCVLLAAGCLGSRPEPPEQEGPSQTLSLNDFLQQLQRQGVSIAQEGPPGDAVVADGVRIRVNSRELVDVYVFQNATQASSQASSLAAIANRPFRIYQRHNVLAVRLTNQDPSVDSALEEVLGPARF
jgi:hypothetical protein